MFHPIVMVSNFKVVRISSPRTSVMLLFHFIEDPGLIHRVIARLLHSMNGKTMAKKNQKRKPAMGGVLLQLRCQLNCISALWCSLSFFLNEVCCIHLEE